MTNRMELQDQMVAHLKLDDKDDSKKLTLLDNMLNVPLFIFEEIIKHTDFETWRNMQLLDDALKARCLYTSKVLTYRPDGIIFKNGNIFFLYVHEDQNVILTEEEFKNSRIKVVADFIDLGILIKGDVNKLIALFDKRVVANVLHIEKFQCSIDKVTQLIEELEVIELDIGCPNSDEPCFPNKLIQHPVMKQIENLTAVVTPEGDSLDPYFANNFKRLDMCFYVQDDAEFANALKGVFKDWLMGKRVIEVYVIVGPHLEQYIDTILHGWTFVNKDDEEEYAGRRPLAVICNEGVDQCYKLLGYKNEELHLMIDCHHFFLHTAHHPDEEDAPRSSKD